MNFWNLLFLGKQNFYHKTNWYEALFAKVVGAGRQLIAKFLKIKGNTIVWNQLVKNGNFADGTTNWYKANGDISVANGELTVTVGDAWNNDARQSLKTYANHKYFACFDAKADSTIAGNSQLMLGQFDSGIARIDSSTLTTSYQTTSGIIASTVNSTGIRLSLKSNGSSWVGAKYYVKNVNLIDLTAMFGSGNEPTADEFTSLYSLPYYDYDSGSLLSFGKIPLTFNQLVENSRGNVGDDIDTTIGLIATKGKETWTFNGTVATANAWTPDESGHRPTYVSGHKYLLKGGMPDGSSSTHYVQAAVSGSGWADFDGKGYIFTCTKDGVGNVSYVFYPATYTNFVCYAPMLIDLTAMFGAGNEPSTVAEFRSMYPDNYYPYESGSNGNMLIKTVGKNLLPKAVSSNTMNGITWALNDDGTIHVEGTSTGRSYIRITISNVTRFMLPKGNYVYTLAPSGDGISNITSLIGSYKYGSTSYYKNVAICDNRNNFIANFSITDEFVDCVFDIAVEVQTSGKTLNCDIKPMIRSASVSDDSYEPYTKSITSLPISTYFPTGMKSAGSVHDELTNSKAITRVSTLTLDGTQTWKISYNRTNGDLVVYLDGDWGSYPNTYTADITSNIAVVWANKQWSGTDTCVAINVSGELCLAIAGCTTQSAVNTYLTSNPVYLAYALATEQVVDIDPPLKLNYQVWNGGTEQLLPINGADPVTTPISADIKYPDGERDNQYFTYRQYLPNSQMLGMALNTILGRSVTTDLTQEALDILMKGE